MPPFAEQGVGGSTGAPRHPRGHPRTGLPRAHNTPADPSQVTAGVCCACASARLPAPASVSAMRKRRALGTAAPCAEVSRAQRRGKLNLLYVKKINYFHEVKNGRSKRVKVIRRVGHQPWLFPSATSGQQKKNKSVHGGPHPGSCPRSIAPAPTRKDEHTEHISFISHLNFCPYSVISARKSKRIQNSVTEFGEWEDKGRVPAALSWT
ncbi:unnamed protein product [Coccothraustes coccothraustes]